MNLGILHRGRWLNRPKIWSLDGSGLAVTTDERTDFWRNTYYGFRRDNGHFWHARAEGDFTATIVFEGEYRHLYDQAGLMLRLDRSNWIKFGIEHSDGHTNFSIVVTRENSDWSVTAQPVVSGPQTVRLTRLNGAVIAHFKRADGNWQLLRVADFPGNVAADIGFMACSPERAGFQARFSEFSIFAPIEKPLHG
jgi:uncharacterized protein